MTTPYSSNRKLSLGDVMNVKIDNNLILNNNVLAYNSTTDLWENKTVLEDLLNIHINTLANDDVIIYDSSAGQWQNKPVPIKVTDNDSNQDYTFIFTDGSGINKILNTQFQTTLNPSNGNLSVVDTLKISQLTVAIGKGSGESQGSYATAIGAYAGLEQLTDAIAVGRSSGSIAQQADSIAIGRSAGFSNQQGESVAVGRAAGQTTQGQKSVAIGTEAGQSNQGQEGTAIGTESGKTSQGQGAIAMGHAAGESGQGTNSIAIGKYAGRGITAGTEQGIHSVAVGYYSAEVSQGREAVAMGNYAGNNSQGAYSVAVGGGCGGINQGTHAVALGFLAGNSNQQNMAIAIGNTAGNSGQKIQAVSIGAGCGTTNQGEYGVAIGTYSGNQNQKTDGIAIGRGAGFNTQGANSIAIGRDAGYSNQPDNNICLNASGLTLNPATSGLFIDPVRAVADPSTFNTLYYDTSTKEIVSTPVIDTSGSTVIENNVDAEFNLVFTDGAGNNKALYVDTSLLPTTGSGIIQNSTFNPYQGYFNISNTIRVGLNNTTSIGKGAGLNQGMECCSVGYQAGVGALDRSIAIGAFAGYLNQDTDSVVIGYRAGQNNAGQNCILIGKQAGRTSSVNNSIVLNATGNDVGSTQAGLFVKPIRALTSNLDKLYYNTITGEISSSNSNNIIINNPNTEIVLTSGDCNRNINIYNTTNVTNIKLPALSTLNNKQVIFTFVIETLQNIIKISSSDNEIVGNVISGGSNYTRLDQNLITGSAGLNHGDTISFSNYNNGSIKSWYIYAGGITTNISGFY